MLGNDSKCLFSVRGLRWNTCKITIAYLERPGKFLMQQVSLPNVKTFLQRAFLMLRPPSSVHTTSKRLVRYQKLKYQVRTGCVGECQGQEWCLAPHDWGPRPPFEPDWIIRLALVSQVWPHKLVGKLDVMRVLESTVLLHRHQSGLQLLQLPLHEGIMWRLLHLAKLRNVQYKDLIVCCDRHVRCLNIAMMGIACYCAAKWWSMNS